MKPVVRLLNRVCGFMPGDYAMLGKLINEGTGFEDAARRVTGNPLVRRRLAHNGKEYVAIFELRRGQNAGAANILHQGPGMRKPGPIPHPTPKAIRGMTATVRYGNLASD